MTPYFTGIAIFVWIPYNYANEYHKPNEHNTLNVTRLTHACFFLGIPYLGCVEYVKVPRHLILCL
jgi:hypothetical protein